MNFQELYDKLNPAQREAVDAIEGPVMVVAGPGTGKTQILTLRIANILQKTQVNPENILALTFTEAGTKEMKRRLRSIIGSTADRVHIHTYHSFAARVIAEYDDHFPHLYRFEQITDIEAESLIREILKNQKFSRLRPLGEPDFYIAKILSGIRDAKKEAWTPAMVAQFAQEETDRIRNTKESISTRGATRGALKAEALKQIEKCEKTLIFSQIYESYEHKKHEQKKMDFDDLIVELTLTLEHDQLLLRLLQEKYQYMLVDEHQDTNDAQNKLIRLIAEFFDNPNLFVVGDEKQAIYRFQGASVGNFLRFQTTWAGMKIIRLENNYRSTQDILDASFRMIENNYAPGQHEQLRVRLRASDSETRRPIDYIVAENDTAADQYLVSELRKFLADNSSRMAAVIVRRNRDVNQIFELLRQENISASAERGGDIFSSAIGSLFFALLEFLTDPSQREALMYTIAGGLWMRDLGRQSDLIARIRAGDITVLDRDLPGLEILRKELPTSGAVAFIILCGQVSGLVARAVRDPLSVQVWDGIVSLSEELAEQNPDDAFALIKALLEYKNSTGTKIVKVASGMPGARIRIMTAHGAKGLEFDTVFLPYATEESWFSRHRGTYFILPQSREEGDDLRDERRLFYVALTRARKRNVIITPLASGSNLFTPLPFIDELDQRSVATIHLPAIERNRTHTWTDTIDTQRRQELVHYAQTQLRERGLSVTALNHFCECPRRFFYKSILRLPEAPSTSSEKGNAMHEAIAAVWRQEQRTSNAITETLLRVTRAYFEKSLLPSFEKEAAQAELSAAAPIVAAALKDHFNQSGQVSTETWHEKYFSTSYQGTSIEFSLHGKLDATVENKDLLAVFDYKTREAMSANAIRGQTKDSDGNYFRQLVFYTLLLGDQAHDKKLPLEASLVFVKPDTKGRCPIISLPVTSEDLKKIEFEINGLAQSVWSGAFLDGHCEDPDCPYCALRQMM